MRRSPSISLLFALAALAIPAVAHAKPLDDLRKAKVQAVTATVKLSETRCPAGTTTECGKTQLDETFSTSKPRTTTVQGQPGYPAGLRIPGKGTGSCYAESPTTMQTAPDGSVQMLAGSALLLPGEFATTSIASAGNSRGVRVAWLEPVAPSIDCDYFQQPDTTLGLPAAQAVPSALVSPVISARTLKRSRFSVTIAGSQNWNDTGADGTVVTGTASWKLRLDYVARGRTAAKRRAPARS